MKTGSVLGLLEDLVFPRDNYCLCCGDIMEPSRIHGVCDSCAAKIDWNTADPFGKSGEEYFFDELLPCCRYGAHPRRIISGLKLGGRPYAAGPLGVLLAERLRMAGVKDAIVVPVPMYAEKQKQRGFNQAELLADRVSRELGLEYYPKALVKTEPTKSMRLSSGEERRSLQSGVFKPGRDAERVLHGAHVVLVDDVVTTGSTADACAKVLKDCGAARVSVLCFAVSAGYKMLDTDRTNDVE